MTQNEAGEKTGHKIILCDRYNDGAAARREQCRKPLSTRYFTIVATGSNCRLVNHKQTLQTGKGLMSGFDSQESHLTPIIIQVSNSN